MLGKHQERMGNQAGNSCLLYDTRARASLEKLIFGVFWIDDLDQQLDQEILAVDLVAIQGQGKRLPRLHLLPEGMSPAFQGDRKIDLGNRLLL